MHFVYILKSLKIENWHYVGSCADINKRKKQHDKGSVKSTKSKRPLEIIYTEKHQTKKQALQRENFLKSPKGYLTKKEILNKYYAEVAQG